MPWLERHALATSLVAGTLLSNFRNQGVYTIGGPGPQDVIGSFVGLAPTGGLSVRGYSPGARSGNTYMIGNGEWRFPIAALNQGFSTAPFFLRQLKGRFFMDAGTAYSGYILDADPMLGAGAEISLVTVIGYYLSGTLRLGWAQGLVGEDTNSGLYLYYGGGF